MEGTPQQPSGASPHIQVAVENLTKAYPAASGPKLALGGVSLSASRGEFLVLLGPSGCGKTTLLRCIAGLEQPSGGRISVHGRIVTDPERRVSVPPEGRRLSMVFQSYALWPHMSVAENVAYPLRNAGVSTADVRKRVQAVLETVGLATFQARYPGQLSGGQQQRVALARAMATDSGVVLFDEPLSNLDAKFREKLRLELATLQRRIGFTAIYVTHDQTEAMALADRIAVMDQGRLAQVGSPKEIYSNPSSRYVATFMGSPNETTGTVVDRIGEMCRIDTPLGSVLAQGSSGLKNGMAASVLFRPEHCRIRTGNGTDAVNIFSGQVERTLFLGTHVEHVVTAAGQPIVIRSTPTDPEPPRDVRFEVEPARVMAFPLEGAAA